MNNIHKIYIIILIIIKQLKTSIKTKNLFIYFFLKILYSVFGKQLIIKQSIRNNKYTLGQNKYKKTIEFKFIKKHRIDFNNNNEILLLMFVLNRRYHLEVNFYYDYLRNLNLNKTHEIIELGCGPSFFLNDIANVLKYKYIGIDHSKEALSIAKSLNKNNMYKIDNIDKIKIQKNKIYIGNSILNHINNPSELLKKISDKKSIYTFIEDEKILLKQNIKIVFKNNEYIYTNFNHHNLNT